MRTMTVTSLRDHAERRAESANDLDKLRECREAIQAFRLHIDCLREEVSGHGAKTALNEVSGLVDALCEDGCREIGVAINDLGHSA